MREDSFAVEAPDPTIVQTEKVQNFLEGCRVRAQKFERKVALVSNDSLGKAKARLVGKLRYMYKCWTIRAFTKKSTIQERA